MTDQITPISEPTAAAASEARAWHLVISGLCGGHPPADDQRTAQANFEMREQMKTFASAGLRLCPSFFAVERAPFFLMHAYSHYWRAYSAVSRLWPCEVYDSAFPDGLSFGLYLSAWLHALGVPKLGCTPADLDAIKEATCIGPKAHPLLPIGRSEFNIPTKSAA